MQVLQQCKAENTGAEFDAQRILTNNKRLYVFIKYSTRK